MIFLVLGSYDIWGGWDVMGAYHDLDEANARAAALMNEEGLESLLVEQHEGEKHKCLSQWGRKADTEDGKSWTAIAR